MVVWGSIQLKEQMMIQKVSGDETQQLRNVSFNRFEKKMFKSWCWNYGSERWMTAGLVDTLNKSQRIVVRWKLGGEMSGSVREEAAVKKRDRGAACRSWGRDGWRCGCRGEAFLLSSGPYLNDGGDLSFFCLFVWWLSDLCASLSGFKCISVNFGPFCCCSRLSSTPTWLQLSGLYPAKIVLLDMEDGAQKIHLFSSQRGRSDWQLWRRRFIVLTLIRFINPLPVFPRPQSWNASDTFIHSHTGWQLMIHCSTLKHEILSYL